uniref:Uncharacterized protein n=1 Tax=Anguilla anguilla TaxID=7936 RepID=A0A0E9UA59_ANGAN
MGLTYSFNVLILDIVDTNGIGISKNGIEICRHIMQ